MTPAHPQAEFLGQHFVVRLTAWQMLVFISSGVLVVGSVWMTTRDLSREVSALRMEVTKLSKSIIQFDSANQALRDRVLRLELLTSGKKE